MYHICKNIISSTNSEIDSMSKLITVVHVILPLHLKPSLDHCQRIQTASDRERGQHAERKELGFVHHVPLDGADERCCLYRGHFSDERRYCSL